MSVQANIHDTVRELRKSEKHADWGPCCSQTDHCRPSHHTLLLVSSAKHKAGQAALQENVLLCSDALHQTTTERNASSQIFHQYCSFWLFFFAMIHPKKNRCLILKGNRKQLSIPGYQTCLSWHQLPLAERRRFLERLQSVLCFTDLDCVGEWPDGRIQQHGVWKKFFLKSCRVLSAKWKDYGLISQEVGEKSDIFCFF